MKDIITSLFIYKSQIYTSSLDGNISQTDIETKYISNEKVEFSLNKYFEETIILDIKAYKNSEVSDKNSGVKGVIIGRALYDGAIKAKDALSLL